MFRRRWGEQNEARAPSSLNFNAHIQHPPTQQKPPPPSSLFQFTTTTTIFIIWCTHSLYYMYTFGLKLLYKLFVALKNILFLIQVYRNEGKSPYELPISLQSQHTLLAQLDWARNEPQKIIPFFPFPLVNTIRNLSMVASADGVWGQQEW